MARSKTLTKAQHKEHRDLCTAKERAYVNVFIHSGLENPRFSDALNAAPKDVRDSYEQARWLLGDFESRMVREGRAWLASFGMFTPY